MTKPKKQRVHKCCNCGGDGKVVVYTCTYPAFATVNCLECGGKGYISHTEAKKRGLP